MEVDGANALKSRQDSYSKSLSSFSKCEYVRSSWNSLNRLKTGNLRVWIWIFHIFNSQDWNGIPLALIHHNTKYRIAIASFPPLFRLETEVCH